MFDNYYFQRRLSPISIDWKEIEDITVFPLPDDYKYFLENYNGYEGFIGPEFLRLWSYENLLKNNNGYQIFDDLPLTIAIGTNGGSEFLAIEKTALHNTRIVLSPFIDLSQEYHIEIGISFSDMLNRLDNRTKWFI